MRVEGGWDVWGSEFECGRVRGREPQNRPGAPKASGFENHVEMIYASLAREVMNKELQELVV